MRDMVLNRDLYLVQNVLGSSSKKNGTGFRVFAANNKAEELVANLLHLKQTSSSTNV